MITRRKFLHNSGLATTALLMKQLPSLAQAPAVKALTLDPNALAKFVDPLPIPVTAQPSEHRASPANPAVKVPYYKLGMRPFEMKVHRDLRPTRMWGFGSQSPGPTFDVRGGQEILVEWSNELPDKHFLPIDHNLSGAGKDQPEVRTVVHLHGGKAPADSDGYPEDWITPGKSVVYHYPNKQDAAMLWYHDHAMGINRLNIYAGLFGVYLIRDSVEDSLNLPAGKYEIPLALCDRMLTPEGQLFYPVSDKENAPWVPEVFGDGTLVNGKLFPYLEVAARQISFSGAECIEWALLPFVVRKRRFVLSDWDGPGIVAGADFVEGADDRAGRASGFGCGLQRTSRRGNDPEERRFHDHAIPRGGRQGGGHQFAAGDIAAGCQDPGIRSSEDAATLARRISKSRG